METLSGPSNTTDTNFQMALHSPLSMSVIIKIELPCMRTFRASLNSMYKWTPRLNPFWLIRSQNPTRLGIFRWHPGSCPDWRVNCSYRCGTSPSIRGWPAGMLCHTNEWSILLGGSIQCSQLAGGWRCKLCSLHFILPLDNEARLRLQFDKQDGCPLGNRRQFKMPVLRRRRGVFGPPYFLPPKGPHHPLKA
jgi:hypothetical protein